MLGFSFVNGSEKVRGAVTKVRRTVICVFCAAGCSTVMRARALPKKISVKAVVRTNVGVAVKGKEWELTCLVAIL